MIFKADSTPGGYKLTCETSYGKQFFLWSVYVHHPHKGVERHFVLTDTADNSVRMARCAAGCPDYETPKEIEGLIECHTLKLPLTIQGWGKNKF